MKQPPNVLKYQIMELSTSRERFVPSPSVILSADKGRKLVFDNFDFRQEVHHMTQDHQNVDVHWVTHMAVENRVSGNHLPSDRPVCQIQALENGQCLPGRHEHHLQRENYITLTERAIVEIPCLSFLKGVVVQHILHQYSKEMSETSTTESLYTFHLIINFISILLANTKKLLIDLKIYFIS